MKILIENMELRGTNSLCWVYTGVFYARDIDPKVLDSEVKRVEFILNELTEVKETGEAPKNLKIDAHQDTEGQWVVDQITAADVSG